jgi:hypothetical protein
MKVSQFLTRKLVWAGAVFILGTVLALADSPVRHPNGTQAWSGSNGRPVYHESGKQAWSGSRGTPVYYENGKQAWSGSSGTPCYHDNGTQETASCSGVTVSVGRGINLEVDRGGAAVIVYGNRLRD